MAECIITKRDVTNYSNDGLVIKYTLLINKNKYDLIFDSKISLNMTDDNRHILSAWLFNNDWPFDDETKLTEGLIVRAVRQVKTPSKDPAKHFEECLDYFILNLYLKGGKEFKDFKITLKDYLWAFAKEQDEFRRLLVAAMDYELIEKIEKNHFIIGDEFVCLLKKEGITKGRELAEKKNLQLLVKSNRPLRGKKLTIIYAEEDKEWGNIISKMMGDRGASLLSYANGISKSDNNFLSAAKDNINNADFVLFIKSENSDKIGVWRDVLTSAVNFEEIHTNSSPLFYVLSIDDSPYDDYQQLTFLTDRAIDIRIKPKRDFLFLDIFSVIKDRGNVAFSPKQEKEASLINGPSFNWPTIELSPGQSHWLKQIYDNFVKGKLIDEKEEPKHWKIFGKEKSPTRMNNLLLSGRSICLLGIWHINKNSKYFDLFDKAIFAIQNLFIEKGAIEKINSRELSDILSISNNTELWCIKELIISSGFTNGSSENWTDNVFSLSFNGHTTEKFRLYEGVEKYIQNECIRNGETGFKKEVSKVLEPKGEKINETPFLNSSKIAGINNDGDSGIDHLDITKDVTAFAKIISSKSFVPPLAIALFGDWGTGKSFFMNKLKDKIKDLSSNSGNNSYCAGIVQIHFNAWSYLDANLWASIVTQIFEKLNNYIKDDNASIEIKASIEKKLASELTISKEQQEFYKKQKQENEAKLQQLKVDRGKLKGGLQGKIGEIKKVTFDNFIKKVDKEFKFNDRINQALNKNTSLKKTKDELKEIIPERYWSNPASLYNEAQSKATFIREFFKKERVGVNTLWIIGILSVILFVPIILNGFTDWAKNANFSIPQIVSSVVVIFVPIIKRLKNTYHELQPLISAFWNIKEDYEQQIKNAVFNYEQTEKALKLEIYQKEKELESLDISIQEAQKSINILEFKINNTLSTEALYSFIDKRSNSDDYKKHLGIVSYIRKDFEILSQLFIEHTEEVKILEFRKKLERPLERIILYVDDLDRCSEEQVVQVLEAVNLLMAFPLFVVVVGVDPRWVKNALIQKYRLQFTGKYSDTNGVSELIKIDASNYLEKIFQIPFHLKEASDINIKGMIQQLSRPAHSVNEPVFADSDINKGVEENEIIDLDELNLSFVRAEEIKLAKLKEAKKEDEFLELSEKEMIKMQNISMIIGTNPRAVKRFVNVYKIIKAHEELTYNIDKEDKELLILMFLLALPIGPYQKITPLIYSFFETQLPYATLSAFIEENKTSYQGENKILDENEVDLVNDLKKIIVENESLELLLEFNPNDCKKHLQFIKRFTFADII